MMKHGLSGLMLAVLMACSGWLPVYAASPSDTTEECLACHTDATPGIVADWRKGRHGQVSPEEGRQVKGLGLRVSSDKIPENLRASAVGCAECHLLNAEKHKDTFEHNGHRVHTVVTPEDCAVCHVQEKSQFELNIMSHAYGNLMENSLYRDLMKAINGPQTLENGILETADAGPLTRADSCLFCHGTRVEVGKLETRETDFGEMEFPQLKGWPNNGVGRENPDGSRGSCAACHTRHEFSIEMARKPHTCSQCHLGPDVPAYKVYMVSKHGNLYESKNEDWNFISVPWTLGKDFTAPTCATCHVSLVVDEQGSVIARRTHQMSDRIPWRIFGLIYAHPHPASPDTSVLTNPEGLPLPTSLNGQPDAQGLIDEKDRENRKETMQALCLACHSKNWVDGHWRRFEHAIQTTNAMTLTATQIMQTIWEKGLASGIVQKQSPFDELVEKKWTEQWLFHGNSIRYSSAMLGADYGVYDNGRWYQSKNLRDLRDWLDIHSKLKGTKQKTTKPVEKGKP